MRIFTVDAETSPMDTWAWGCWKQNINPMTQIKEPTYLLSWAGKFSDERKVRYHDVHDKHMVPALHECLMQADAVVTYNGDKFDLKHFNREFLLAGLAPTRPIPSIDLLPAVKRQFSFPSYKLDYVASQVLGERKLDTGGFDLWPSFMEGDPKALRLMQRYNKRDTVLTEKLYKHIKPWIPNHPYLGEPDVDIDDWEHEYECPVCLSLSTVKEKPRRTRCFAIRQVRCADCGAWHDGKRKKLV